MSPHAPQLLAALGRCDKVEKFIQGALHGGKHVPSGSGGTGSGSGGGGEPSLAAALSSSEEKNGTAPAVAIEGGTLASPATDAPAGGAASGVDDAHAVAAAAPAAAAAIAAQSRACVTAACDLAQVSHTPLPPCIAVAVEIYSRPATASPRLPCPSVPWRSC